MLRADKMTIEVDGATIAATTSVGLKWNAEALDTTVKEDGIYSTFMAGNIKAWIRGKYLLSNSDAQYSALSQKLRDRSEVVVSVYRDGEQILTGYGILVTLNLESGISNSLITGRYAIRYYPSTLSIGKLLKEGGGGLLLETGGGLKLEG
jgi:hypothetical protein